MGVWASWLATNSSISLALAKSPCQASNWASNTLS